MKDDLSIARQAKLLPIGQVGATIGLTDDELIPYGRTKAKVALCVLDRVPELQKRLGDLRSELVHSEVRSTYDTPEVAENRRIVEQADQAPEFLTPNPEDEEPWRRPPE